ncbi:MAG TPA: hypothetical protein VFW44_05450 [Bryobacteraceae bacterium]|nr:hypothetical protein [Bryobacteraceae bacterium]
MSRWKRFGWLTVISVGGALCVPAADPGVRAQPGPKAYLKKAVRPAAIAMAGMGAGIAQATNTPSEWGQGAAGFGKRLGSAFGKHLVKSAIEYPVAKVRHEALGYERSTDPRFRPRLEHALLATVYTRKTTTGQKTVNTHEIAGAVGSGLISRLWQPASVRTVSAGFGSAGITLGVDAGTNVVREFWPEIRHPHRHVEASNAPSGAVPPAHPATKPWPYY